MHASAASCSIWPFSHLQAGSAPASISSLTAAFWAAAEATCSKVNPAESTGSLSRDGEAGAVDGWLSER